MTLALRGTVQQANGSSAGANDVTLTPDVTLQAGDVWVEYVVASTGITADALLGIAVSGGTWTDGVAFEHNVAARICTGSGETSFTDTCGGGSAGIGFGVSGAAATLPVDPAKFAKNDVTGNATYTTSAVTPSVDNSWHVVGFSDTNGNNTVLTAPSGYTPCGSLQDNAAFGSMVMYRKPLGTGSAGNPVTASLVWNATAYGSAIAFIITPAAGGSVAPAASHHNRQRRTQ
jgi:hypothetical protein